MYINARHSQRMRALCLPLALFLLFSSPVQAQWWSFFWGNSKTSSGSASPSIPPPIPSPSITPLGPSDATGATDVVVLMKEGGAEKAQQGSPLTEGSVLTTTSRPEMPISSRITAEPGLFHPEEKAGGGARYKALKRWKSGE